MGCPVGLGAGMSAPEAPEHLGARACVFWREVLATWSMDAAGLELLRQAVEALDMAERCRADVIASGSMTILDRYGSAKPHPLIASEDTARKTFLAAIRALNLEAGADAKAAGPYLKPAR